MFKFKKEPNNINLGQIDKKRKQNDALVSFEETAGRQSKKRCLDEEEEISNSIGYQELAYLFAESYKPVKLSLKEIC
jgi:hypothetical protein